MVYGYRLDSRSKGFIASVRTIRSSHDGKFRSAKHSKREMIQKVIGVSTGSSFVYIIVSKFGHVGIYDDKFRVAL